MEFIWSCMVLTLKTALGGFFWAMTITGFSLGIALIAFFASGEWKKTQQKPKYKGKPIVVEGGLDKDEK